jgi:tripartite-type tricarboxylate transporter receptor subunit TctC
MTKTRREVVRGAAAIAGSALFAPAVFAQQFPSRNIRVIVPFPAGATTDMLARLIAQRLSDTMGQSVVVENVGGGGGSIGADQVAKAAPDGHTLLFHNITFSTTTSSLLYAKRARHDFDDFVPISVGAYVPLLLLANNSVPPNNLKEFVEYARTTSTPLFYGSTGPGSILHLMGEVLKRDTGIKMDHIPFRGAAPLVTELISGRIQFGGDQLSSSLERVRTNQLKALADTRTWSCKAGTASSGPRARPNRWWRSCSRRSPRR